ncbi:MAG: crossover junction endodeoxyribonuclease RuvC [Patescibacteria group bacterium]|jgi:crossover junction endodeoxyribonuclease RuvC
MPPSKVNVISNVVIGIDPGTAITGYGILEIENRTTKVLEYGVIRTPSKTVLAQRLVLLYAQLTKLLGQYHPAYAGCERLFFSKNVKTALDVGQARGVTLLALAQFNTKLLELTPPQVKQSITGYGAATKLQVQQMTQRILKLTNLPKPDDAADALAIALATQQFARLA